MREAQGEYLVLLNNDTAIIHGDWLDALLNHAQRPEVGMVGAKLLTPQGTIEHAGYLLGVQGAVASAFAGLNASEPGYMHRLEIDQNYSAVSAACMMVRRSLYEELGGMDAQEFPTSGLTWICAYGHADSVPDGLDASCHATARRRGQPCKSFGRGKHSTNRKSTRCPVPSLAACVGDWHL